jgi:hypothetical protein
MIEHVERRFELRLERSVDDTAYGSGSMVHWVVEEKGIEPHISVWDKTQRKDDTFSGSAFKYDEHNDRYECPAGRYLKTAWRSKQKNPYRYRASLYDCQDCVLKQQCCANTPIRKIDSSPYEPARAIAKTKAYHQSGNPSRDRTNIACAVVRLGAWSHL